MSKVILNPFVLRQTSDSQFSYFSGVIADVPAIVEANFGAGKPGSSPLIWIVPVPADGFYSGVVQLSEGCEVTASFKSRKVGEEPRKGFTAKGSKTPAAFVEVVCYHSSILKDDAAGVDCWEIISVNASAIENEPIALESLLYNYFEGSGGTKGDYTPEQFVEVLKASWGYWKDKAMHTPTA